MKRSRIRPMSAKRASEVEQRRQVVDAVIARDRGCTAVTAWPEIECGGALIGHEPGRRRGNGSHLDPECVVAVCWAHHQAIHNRVGLAYERGFLIRGA